MSVRKAAGLFGLPKSTVHRYLQAKRGIERPYRRGAIAVKRAREAPPKKFDIAFLLSPTRTAVEEARI